MTPEQLALIVGSVISFVLGLAPGIKKWFDSKESIVKAGIAAGITILLGTAIYFANCQGFYEIPGIICGKEGVFQWAGVVLNALLGLVAMYISVVRPIKSQ
jgi:hypothetical protein